MRRAGSCTSPGGARSIGQHRKQKYAQHVSVAHPQGGTQYLAAQKADATLNMYWWHIPSQGATQYLPAQKADTRGGTQYLPAQKADTALNMCACVPLCGCRRT